jgi:hypothetical protein
VRRLTGTITDLETELETKSDRIDRTEDLTDQVRALQAANQQLIARAAALDEQLARTGKDGGGAPELASALKVAQTDAMRLAHANEVLTEQVRALTKEREVEGEGIDVEAALARIEAAVGRFEVELPARRGDVALVVRLEALLTALYRILEVFEEQKQSLMRIEGSLPRKRQRSP